MQDAQVQQGIGSLSPNRVRQYGRLRHSLSLPLGEAFGVRAGRSKRISEGRIVPSLFAPMLDVQNGKTLPRLHYL